MPLFLDKKSQLCVVHVGTIDANDSNKTDERKYKVYIYIWFLYFTHFISYEVAYNQHALSPSYSNTGSLLINIVQVIQVDRHAHGKGAFLKPQSYKNRGLIASYHNIMVSLGEFACLWYNRMAWQCKRKCNMQAGGLQLHINSEFCCNSAFLIVQPVCSLPDRAGILFAFYLRSNIPMHTYHELMKWVRRVPHTFISNIATNIGGILTCHTISRDFFQSDKLGCIRSETGWWRAWKSLDSQDANTINWPKTFLICYSTIGNYYDPPIRFQELDY